MPVMRKIIRIDEEKCDGCGQCILACAEGALEIVDGKAKVIADKFCDGLGACLGECPQDALTIIEREADPFDEEAVEELLAQRDKAGNAPHAPSGGCPGAKIETLTPCQAANQPQAMGPAPGAGNAPLPPGLQSGIQGAATGSALSHWPVQIRLVPPHAPFLKNAKLLIAADCTAVASPAIHSNFLPGRVVLMGCPKFDDAQTYIDRLADILAQNDIQDVTILEMEVPCCSGLHKILASAREKASKDTHMERVIIARTGQVLARQTV